MMQHALAVLSHIQPREYISFTLENGHARSQGGRQPAAAKPPWYQKHDISLKRFGVLGVATPSASTAVPITTFCFLQRTKYNR